MCSNVSDVEEEGKENGKGQTKMDETVLGENKGTHSLQLGPTSFLIFSIENLWLHLQCFNHIAH